MRFGKLVSRTQDKFKHNEVFIHRVSTCKSGLLGEREKGRKSIWPGLSDGMVVAQA